jgi:hypothetical protein
MAFFIGAVKTSGDSSLHIFYTRSSSLCQPFTRDQLTFSTSKSATGDQTMDLLYIAGIIAFWVLCAALTIGCDKLRRAPGGRP